MTTTARDTELRSTLGNIAMSGAHDCPWIRDFIACATELESATRRMPLESISSRQSSIFHSRHASSTAIMLKFWLASLKLSGS